MKTRKLLCMLIMLIAMTAVLSFSASAKEIPASGSCGENVTYNYNSTTKKLVISGTGAMTDYIGLNFGGSPFDSSDVKTVIINNGVTSIGAGAFRNCYELTSVTIPDSVTYIGERAFYNCGSLLSIVIPNGVTAIEKYTFSDCFSLNSVTLPDSIASIGNNAFSNCYELSSIRIPDGVTSIGDNAFIYCGLTSITIPDNVTTIDNTAFRYCYDLTSITVGTNNKNYTSDEYGVLFDKNKTKLISYPAGNSRTTYTIPDSVTSIAEYAFEVSANLRSITIPNGVTSIGEFAFYGCESLTSIDIPNGVMSIENCLFTLCQSLESIIIPDSVTSIVPSAFEGCYNLTNITVGANNKNYVNDEDGVVFDKNKTKLIRHPAGNSRTTYTIPDSITYIEERAFEDCANLISIIIPDEVTSIGEFAFNGCKSLISIDIPDSVTTIGDYAFYYCENLTSIIIPDSVTMIGYNVFNEHTTVFCYENSYAHQWCEEEGHPYKFITDGCVHANKKFIAQQNATCTSTGLTAGEYCSDCETWVVERETIAALGHSFTNYKSDNNATFAADGTKTAICGNGCGTKNTVIDEGSKRILGRTSKIVTAQNTSAIKLTWAPVENAAGYAVYQKIDGKWKALGTRTVNNATISKLQTGTKYEFAIKAAAKVNGTTIWSDTYTTIQAATQAIKPAKIAAAQNTNAIKLAWTKCPGATGYRIYYKSGNDWKVTVSTTSATSHTFTGLKAGAKYTFAVRPYIKTTSGVIWSDYTTYTATTTPATVTAKATSTSTGKISLSWNAVAADGYNVYYKVGNGNFKLYKTVKGINSLSFSGLKSGSQYTFAVRAGNSTSGGAIWGGYKTSTVTVK